MEVGQEYNLNGGHRVSEVLPLLAPPSQPLNTSHSTCVVSKHLKDLRCPHKNFPCSDPKTLPKKTLCLSGNPTTEPEVTEKNREQKFPQNWLLTLKAFPCSEGNIKHNVRIGV